MTRTEFMQQLNEALQDLSVEEREDALSYYNEYFDEAGPENEAEVIEDLGGAQKVANIIRANLGLGAAPAAKPTYAQYGAQRAAYDYRKTAQENAQRNPQYAGRQYSQTNNVLWILLLVLTFPLWISVLATVLGIVVSVLAVILGLTVAGGALVIAGVVVLFSFVTLLGLTPTVALLSFGGALACIGLGLLMAIFFGWLLGAASKGLFGAVGNLCQWLFGQRRAV